MIKVLINANVKLVKNIVGGKCRGGVPELDVTKPVPGPRVDNMFAPTARGVNTAPSRLGPAVRRRGGALKYQTDCWVSADAWCLGFVWAREPKPDCCGVVTFAYARLCATTPCGTRTRNLRIRGPTPCPLGQRSPYSTRHNNITGCYVNALVHARAGIVGSDLRITRSKYSVWVSI